MILRNWHYYNLKKKNDQYTYAPLAVKYYYSGSKSGYLRTALFNIIIGVLFLLSTAFKSHPFSTSNLNSNKKNT